MSRDRPFPQIRVVSQQVSTLGGSRLERLRLDGHQSLRVHDLSDTLTSALDAKRFEILDNMPRAIATTMLPKDLTNRR